MKVVSAIVTLSLMWSSCTSDRNPATVVSTSDSLLQVNQICILNENIDLLAQITSFDILDSNHFLVTTHQSYIYIYDMEGVQISKIGSVGRGPFEYLNPLIVRVFDNKIYVWCEMLLKLVVFDRNGNELMEYTGFKSAIRNFIVSRDMVFFYYASGDIVIGVYDLSTGLIVGNFGLPSNEHKALTTLACVAPLTFLNDKIIYMSTDSLILNSINPISLIKSKLEFEDNEFKVRKLERPVATFVGPDRVGLINFITQNSFVSQLYSNDSILVAMAEMGEMNQMSNQELRTDGPKKFDISEKYNKLYFFDRDLNYMYAINLSKGSLLNKCLTVMVGNSIYSIKTNVGEDFHYELIRLDL